MNRQEVIMHITAIMQESGYKIAKTYTKSKYLMQFHIISNETNININTINELMEKIKGDQFFNRYIPSFSIISEELVLQIREK